MALEEAWGVDGRDGGDVTRREKFHLLCRAT